MLSIGVKFLGERGLISLAVIRAEWKDEDEGVKKG